MTLTVLVTVFIVTMAMGIPISFVFGVSSVVYFVFFSNIPITIIGQQLYNGVDSFVLLAIPFFILAGQLMNRTGITEDLVEFCADAGGTSAWGLSPGQYCREHSVCRTNWCCRCRQPLRSGSILIPAMKKEGYSAAYSAAVTTASSIIGPIIPPSIVMVIYGTVTGESIGALFMGGVIPGILIGLGLMILALFYAIRDHHPRRTTSIPVPEKIRIHQKCDCWSHYANHHYRWNFKRKVYRHRSSPRLRVVMPFWWGSSIYRSLSLKDILQSFLESAVISSVILLIISTAKLFGMVLTIERIPTQIAQMMMAVTDNKIIFLLIVNIFLLFMGMIMETGANVILLAPILLPLAIKYGIHPLHFALIMIVNVNIGLTTPPLGYVFLRSSHRENIVREHSNPGPSLCRDGDCGAVGYYVHS